MSRFYLLIWRDWVFRITLCSIILACGLSFLITLFLYIMQGAVKLDTQSLKALKDIFLFWFPLIWSLTILISLFRAIKFIFNKQLNGYAFKLLRCQTKSVIEDISYADLVKPFRKWLMLMIWLVGSLMIVSLISTNLFSGYDSVFE